MAAKYEDRTVVLTFAETVEYAYSADLEEAARTMGLKPAKLARMLDEGEVPDLEFAAQQRVKKAATVENEEFEIEELYEE